MPEQGEDSPWTISHAKTFRRKILFEENTAHLKKKIIPAKKKKYVVKSQMSEEIVCLFSVGSIIIFHCSESDNHPLPIQERCVFGGMREKSKRAQKKGSVLLSRGYNGRAYRKTSAYLCSAISEKRP